MNPFTKPGSFFRGNLHSHSSRSDGGRTPEQVIGDFRDRGYDFMSLTDHFLPNAMFRKDEEGFITITDTRHLDSDDFVTILGAELHGPAMENGELWHMVAVGLPIDFAPLGENETGPEVFRRAKDAGAWLSLAHPHWNTVSENDALAVIDLIDSVEVYNHASEVSVRRGWGMHHADVLLNKGYMVQQNAADDNHFNKPAMLAFVDGFGGWVQVKSESLDAGSLVAALKRGDYYSSTGPEIIDVQLSDSTVKVRCSPALQVVVHSHGSWDRIAFGFNLCEAELELPEPGKGDWIRVTVVDQHGKLAWTNPIRVR